MNKTLDMNGTDAFNNVIVGITQISLTEKSGANVTKIPQYITAVIYPYFF